MTESLKAAVLPDRSVVAIGGPDRVKFLQGLMTNDIRQLAADRTLYAGFLTGRGKLLYDVFLIQDGERILIDIAANAAADFIKRLTAFRIREAVEIAETATRIPVRVKKTRQNKGVEPGFDCIRTDKFPGHGGSECRNCNAPSVGFRPFPMGGPQNSERRRDEDKMAWVEPLLAQSRRLVELQAALN